MPPPRHLRRLAAVLLLALVALLVPAAAELTLAELKKRPVRELRAMLAERGVECKGCSEKAEVAARVFATQHLPLTAGAGSPPPSAAPGAGAPGGPPPDFDADAFMQKMRADRAKNEDLKRKLREAGVNTDGMNFGGDFGNMDPDQLSRMFKNLDKDALHPPKRKGARRAPPPAAAEPAAAAAAEEEVAAEISDEL